MSRILKFGQSMGGIIQEAFIVPDIMIGIEHFTKHLKIGPFFVKEHFPFTDYHHRGKPGEVDITVALGFSGNMCFELIQQNDDNPSVYTETRDKRGWGFHHWALAVATDSYDEMVRTFQSYNAPLALFGVVAGVGSRTAYMDTTATLPGMVEFIEMTPQTEEIFSIIHNASVNWDGKDPVRSFFG